MTKLMLQALIVAGAFTVQASGFQQTTTSSQSQPATTSTAPCNKAPSNPPHKQGWLEQKARALACQKNKNLCDVPSSPSDITGTTPDAKPCPTTATSTTPTAQPIPVPHLPTGVVTTWLCNPIVTSTDPSHTTTFVTPDALTDAAPAQPGVFEADGAKADAKATVSCANLRRDPKNNKVFLAQ